MAPSTETSFCVSPYVRTAGAGCCSDFGHRLNLLYWWGFHASISLFAPWDCFSSLLKLMWSTRLFLLRCSPNSNYSLGLLSYLDCHKCVMFAIVFLLLWSWPSRLPSNTKTLCCALWLCFWRNPHWNIVVLFIYKGMRMYAVCEGMTLCCKFMSIISRIPWYTTW